jgi:ABC-2 type transport system permease protein
MFRNLQIEWMKIKNYRVFQVFSVLYMLGILIIIYIFYKIYIQLTGRLTGRDNMDIFKLFSPENIWKTVCFATSFLLYLPGMILINLFTNEVNFKTHRQNIIDGWKRETFIYTKIGLIVCISLAVVVMNVVATLIMCNVTNTEFSLSSGLSTLGFCFIQSFIYMMFALLLATLFRRSGVAIIVFFAYGLLLENFFVWALWKVLPGGAQHFLPLQVADSLIPFIKEGIFASNPGSAALVPAALAFAGLYIFLAVRKYKYDDL